MEQLGFDESPTAGTQGWLQTNDRNHAVSNETADTAIPVNSVTQKSPGVCDASDNSEWRLGTETGMTRHTLYSCRSCGARRWEHPSDICRCGRKHLIPLADLEVGYVASNVVNCVMVYICCLEPLCDTLPRLCVTFFLTLLSLLEFYS